MISTSAALVARLLSLRYPLIGQHDYITSGTRYRDEIARLSGVVPAVFGSDFSFCYHGENPESIGHCGPANLTEPGHGVRTWCYSPEKVFAPEGKQRFTNADLETLRAALVQRCISLHRQGTAITLMWHAPRPGCGDAVQDGDLWINSRPPATLWESLFDEHSSIHADWCAAVDRVAAHLRVLREYGVPVLWRPYHEMNGGWFWWGKNPEAFRRLWHLLHHRLTNIYGLDNLLWVWNPNAPRDTPGDEAEPWAAYFPGGDVVDILAADVYHNDFRDSHYYELLELAEGRPIALGEVGHLPCLEVLARQPRWAWIMPWGGLVFRFNHREAIRRLYSSLA